jgi:hypothetical protein
MSDMKEGVSLNVVVGSILQALREAKHSGDIESAKLLEVYKKEETLSPFTVPAFSITDVEVELRFSIVQSPEEQNKAGEVPLLKVNISPESLKELDAHQISMMRIKISPESLRVFEDEEK